MSKCLTVVAFVLLVLSGAMGLRNIVGTHSALTTGSSLFSQGMPHPLPGSGGGQ